MMGKLWEERSPIWWARLLSVALLFITPVMGLDGGQEGDPTWLPGGAMEVAVNKQGIVIAATGGGILLADCTDPKHPKALTFVSEEGACGVALRDNLAVVTLYQGGVLILDISNPSKPKALGHCSLPSPACGVALSENLAFVANYDRGVAILDIADPSKPREVKQVDIGWTFGVAAQGNLVLATSYEPAMLFCIDGKELRKIGNYDFQQRFGPYGVAFWGNRRALVADTFTTRIVDISDPKKPEQVGKLPAVSPAPGLPIPTLTHKAAPLDDRHFVAVGIAPSGLRVYEASDPAKPQLVGFLPLEGNCYDVAVWGEVAIVANGSKGVALVDLSSLSEPRLLARIPLPPPRLSTSKPRQLKDIRLQVRGKYIVAADGKPYMLMGVAWLTGDSGMMGNSPLLRRMGSLEQYARHFRRMGMNAIRLAVAGYPPSSEGLLENYIGGGIGGGMVPVALRFPDPEEYVEKVVVPEVERAKRAGMYVVLDLHAFSGDYHWLWGWGMRFWRAVSRRFHDDPYVAIYQLTNEPSFFPDVLQEAVRKGTLKVTSEQIRELHASTLRRWYQDLIAMFRAMGDRHPVLVHDYGVYWYVTEKMWSPIEFRPDPLNQVIWGMHPVLREWKVSDPGQAYVRNLMDKWNIPVFFDEYGTVSGSGPHVALPETLWFSFQHWLLGEPRKIGFLLWFCNGTDDEIQAEWWAPVCKALSAENPPPPPLPGRPFKALFTISAEKAEGGELVTVSTEEGKWKARTIPAKAPVGSYLTFPLPQPLPPGRYQVRVLLYSEGGLAPPLLLKWVDTKGHLHPPDEEFSKWAGQDYFFTDAFVVPLFIQGDGFQEWRTEIEVWTEITAVAFKKVGQVEWYLPPGNFPGLTRPILEVGIAPKSPN